MNSRAVRDTKQDIICESYYNGRIYLLKVIIIGIRKANLFGNLENKRTCHLYNNECGCLIDEFIERLLFWLIAGTANFAYVSQKNLFSTKFFSTFVDPYKQKPPQWAIIYQSQQLRAMMHNKQIFVVFLVTTFIHIH